MKCPTTAVIDADILIFKAACWADVEGVEYLEDRIHNDVEFWTPKECSKVVMALSCKRDDNFRMKIWPDYKANRKGKPTPDCLQEARRILKDSYKIIEKPSIEADDIMGILMSSGKAVACTIDKDLRSVPGWLFIPGIYGDAVLENTPQDRADFNFHLQWLTGDTTDNIPGIWKVGTEKALKILNAVEPKDYTKAVINEYKTRPDKEGKPYDGKYCLKMARLVRILRDGDYSEGKVKLWKP